MQRCVKVKVWGETNLTVTMSCIAIIGYEAQHMCTHGGSVRGGGGSSEWVQGLEYCVLLCRYIYIYTCMAY